MRIRPALPARLLALLLLAVGCSAATPPPDQATRHEPDSQPSWCGAVQAALGETTGFDCLEVPNFLVTGFYGTPDNPERSDFVNGCFAGEADAAERLRMSVRPAGNLSFAYQVERTANRTGEVGLGFLGPWAPTVRASDLASREVEVSVRLSDAEIRVLASVPEILVQQYLSAESSEVRDALEVCIDALCESGSEQLSYTAKVLAAVPVIEVRAKSADKLSSAVKLLEGAAGFEVATTTGSRASIQIRAKEKLNVAALLERARPAFQKAGACKQVEMIRTRRQVAIRLRELGLRTLSGRELDTVPREASELRSLLTQDSSPLPTDEREDVLETLEAIEGASRQLVAEKPSDDLCGTQALLANVLTGEGSENRLHDIIADVAEPLHRRLLDLANEYNLPCAEPIWFLDADGDGYGDKDETKRAPKQPKGHVANSLDCYDRNKNARPGQTKYFADHRGDGSFDYDCDGRATPREVAVSAGCREITRFGIPIRCWADSGWRGAAPKCGQRGKWLAACEASTFSCEESNERPESQSCR